METNIQIFKNEVFGEIRTMTNEKGETFFVGKDVAQALGYSNSRKALLDHVDEEDKGVTKRDTLGVGVCNKCRIYPLELWSQAELKHLTPNTHHLEKNSRHHHRFQPPREDRRLSASPLCCW